MALFGNHNRAPKRYLNLQGFILGIFCFEPISWRLQYDGNPGAALPPDFWGLSAGLGSVLALFPDKVAREGRIDLLVERYAIGTKPLF